jgi:hypothetical protein
MVIESLKRDFIVKASVTYNGKPLMGKKLYFKYKPHNKSEWIDIGEAITNDKGIAEKIVSLEEGLSFDFEVEFKGDDEFEPESVRWVEFYVKPTPKIDIDIVPYR